VSCSAKFTPNSLQGAACSRRTLGRGSVGGPQALFRGTVDAPVSVASSGTFGDGLPATSAPRKSAISSFCIAILAVSRAFSNLFLVFTLMTLPAAG
jgi:hypothetical protein